MSNQNRDQQQQWTHIPYQPPTTSSGNQTYQTYGTSQQQATAQRPGLTIHQYRPASPQAAPSRYPVTAPFLVPRMPNAWPAPGGQTHGQQSGAQNAPIDPRLLSGTQVNNNTGTQGRGT